MKIIKQIVMTVYDDGSTKMTERGLSKRDKSTGRFIPNLREPRDDTPFFPELESYMQDGHEA